MNKPCSALLCVATGIACSSCATVFCGSRAKVTFDTNVPVESATLTIDGKRHQVTAFPYKTKVKRGFTDSEVKAEAPGYEPVRFTIYKTFNAVSVINLFDVLGWSYRSGFFGRSILSLRPGEGRAWISTYQILGRLEEGGLVTLEPVRESSVLAWSSAEGLGGPLDEEEKRARLERTVADYQLAGDLFARGGLKEEEVLR